MNSEKKTAVLAVSFGTSYPAARKNCIEAIEASIREALPDCMHYRAWTSKKILAKLKDRDGLHIDNVKEAMERMVSDGITDVVVQPTHVINGIENDEMKKDVLCFSDRFGSIRFGTPLLTSEEDQELVINAIAEEFRSLPSGEALVLMGHGTTHYANSIYAALDFRFKDMGYPHIFLGTVEAYPGIDQLLRMVKSYNPSRVTLAPFMIVAGDHANHDMAGDSPDSWLSQFENVGFSVRPVLKGLGEYKGIQEIFVRHVQEVLKSPIS